MIVLGIESSCDECSMALVENGHKILGMVTDTQIRVHALYDGVVPEIASRMHLEAVVTVFRETLRQSGVALESIEAVAATRQPGLSGSLLVGHSFAKAFSFSRELPFIGVDHMLAHLYAPRLATDVSYPFLGLLVSGGHSMIVKVSGIDDIEVLGASIDDAVGEAFDKVAKHYGLGYPGGKAVDDLARQGNAHAFNFPLPNLYKGDHAYDVSYSGLKNAVINQTAQFKAVEGPTSLADLLASFQRVAVDVILRRLLKAVHDTGIRSVVAGGGVTANNHLRARLSAFPDCKVLYPPLELCGDNGAMVAGLGYHLIARGDRSALNETVKPRVEGFRKAYP